jgi:ABC-type multidrug transport system fused ATPase/permease subunit
MTLKIPAKLQSSTIFRSLQTLPVTDRSKILAVVLLQITLALLDLAGVAVMGIVGALAVTGVQSLKPGGAVLAVLEVLNLQNLSFQKQVAILAILASLILILRTVLSVVITRRIFFFLSRRGAFLSARIVSKLLTQSILQIQSRSTHETIYALTTGVTSITLGILGGVTTLIADVALLTIMLVGLLVIDPLIAGTSLLFFGLLGFTLFRLMNVKAMKLGILNAKLNVGSNEKITEVIQTYRETLVHNRREYYSREIGKLRLNLANVLAEIQFMPNVSKYVIESSMIVGAIAIAGIQFAILDAKSAVATLAVFLAAGTRIAPAIMRLQQTLIQIKNSVGAAMPTLELIESLENVLTPESVSDEPVFEHRGFVPSIKMEKVSLMYPGSRQMALNSVSLNVDAGSSLAIVGPSGAGKTSIIDVLLGVLGPQSGKIEISDLTPGEAIRNWPGAISYVPQEVILINGTIRQNVALGYPSSVATDERCLDSLAVAQLSDFVLELPLGLDALIGDRGVKLSGGQRQRLGIARAMFTKPKLLVLDEATSALDAQTELAVSAGISSLKGSVTVVTVAHRLSTVRNAEKVIYLEYGKIIASGTFDEVRSAVPNFDYQAQLMGL